MAALATVRRVSPVADETVGAQVERRRRALGVSKAQLADIASVHRNTMTRIANDDPNVEPETLEKVLRALDSMERRYGMQDPDAVTSVVELPDGSRVVFTGSKDNVVDAAKRFLGRRNGGTS